MAANGNEAITLNQLKQFDSSGGVNIWPIGSIYMSVNPTDPSTLFGGTWERIQGRFLFAADSKHAAGSTGGEETHKLTVSEIPSHSHSVEHGTRFSNIGHNIAPGGTGYIDEKKSAPAGGGAAHNNMPPYLAIYVWKRVS